MTLADELHNLPDPAPEVVWAKGFLLRTNDGALTIEQLQAAFDAGYRFIDLRASWGTTPGSLFPENWDNAGQVGFLRAASHWLHPTKTGQAAAFREAVGERVPELGIYGDLTSADVTLEKCDLFLQAADRNFGQTCNVMTSNERMAALGYPAWQSEGRKLNIYHTTDNPVPTVPQNYTDWELWVHAYEQVPPLPVALYMLRYNGTDADLYAEYGGSIEQAIAELLLAQAKNAEAAVHIANALAILQGPQ